ncbi:hypothetical protein P8452_56057 [Trifolium repens]|nr:hypothetical protein P8452_56057 [Trifolium repens]
MIGKSGIKGSGNRVDWESIKIKVGILGGMMNKLIFVIKSWFEVCRDIAFSSFLYLSALTEGNAIHKKTEFNILPLEQGGIQHAIMQQPEIKVSIAVIHNIRGLPPAQDFKKHGAFVDLFDFLQHCFGFHEANVANQREHLIILLANMQTRQTHNQTSVMKLGEGGVDELMRKFFKNHTTWCKILERKSNIR